jgi:hypothetical protein
MKKNTPSAMDPLTREPTEEEIRDYAYHLYQQSGCTPGHDLDNWLEAKACLEASISPQHTRVRLHRQRHGATRQEATIIALADPKEKQSNPLSAVEREDSGVKGMLATAKPRK